jgi:RNA polymerase sigma factor (sigma-70 family)
MEILDIIEGCKNNNPKAQAMLYKLYHTRMISIAYKYSNGGSDVEDLVQEAFITIYKKISSFNYDSINQFDFWVYNIVKNKTLDLYRKNKGITKVEIHDGLLHYDEQESFYDIFIDHIPTIIDSLSSKYRNVLTLYYIKNKTHTEISVLLGISVSSSKINLLRGKLMVKNSLKKLYPIV